MKYQELIHQRCLYFSRWSKKGYSIFAGLGHEVRISHLALHMYEKVLLKSASNGVIVSTDRTVEICPLVERKTDQVYHQAEKQGEMCPKYNCAKYYKDKGYIAFGSISLFN